MTYAPQLLPIRENTSRYVELPTFTRRCVRCQSWLPTLSALLVAFDQKQHGPYCQPCAAVVCESHSPHPSSA